MFSFAHPLWFLLLPLALAAIWRMHTRQKRHAIRFGPTGRLPRRMRTWRSTAVPLAAAAYSLALVLMVAAMARPRTLYAVSRQMADVIAIEMVVDVSGSMEALDLSTPTPLGPRYRTRLDVVKETFDAFIAKRPDDLIGLVVFGGYASTLVPLTGDHDALRHVLAGVEIPGRLLDERGQVLNEDELLTAIGDALATACARLRDTEPVSRIIVLLSDGDSNTGVIAPETAIETARKLGIRVYTIGIGSTGRAPVRVRDALGRDVIRQAWITFDEALLQRVADETGGVYYNVRDAKGLDRALEAINALETTRVEQQIIRHHREHFTFWLMPALALALAGITLNSLSARRIL